MPNSRYFAILQTHVLLPSAPTGDVHTDRDAVYAALGEGSATYVIVRGAGTGNRLSLLGGGTTPARAPMGARADPGADLRAVDAAARPVRLLRDGEHEAEGDRLEHTIEENGCYRPARLPDDERERLWLVSNPVYVAGGRAPAQRAV